MPIVPQQYVWVYYRYCPTIDIEVLDTKGLYFYNDKKQICGNILKRYLIRSLTISTKKHIKYKIICYFHLSHIFIGATVPRYTSS